MHYPVYAPFFSSGENLWKFLEGLKKERLRHKMKTLPRVRIYQDFLSSPHSKTYITIRISKRKRETEKGQKTFKNVFFNSFGCVGGSKWFMAVSPQ
jgi:hypothetical protein